MRLELTGPAAPVVDSVRLGEALGAPGLAFSPTGALAYILAPQGYRLVWVDHQGRARLATERQARYGPPRLSPDAQHVAVPIQDQTYRAALFRLDLERDAMTKIADEASTPVWTPNGERLIFGSLREGLNSMEVAGRGVPRRLTSSSRGQSSPTVSPDGRLLAFSEFGRDHRFDIMVLDLAGEGEPRPFVTDRGGQVGSTFSPNGKWIAYTSNEAGPDEVYAKLFPGPGPSVLISRDGGVGPAWAPDGKSIYYLKGSRMMVVPLTYEPDLRPGKPQLLFEGRFEGGERLGANYDITPDGERFLMVQGEATPITVVLDWFDELERLVPTTGE